jgi:hypothetical protein
MRRAAVKFRNSTKLGQSIKIIANSQSIIDKFDFRGYPKKYHQQKRRNRFSGRIFFPVTFAKMLSQNN